MAVAGCMEEGLVSGHGFAVDASLITADVQKQNSSNPKDWEARDADPQDTPRAVQEYLSTLDDEAFGAASEVTPKFIAHAAQRHPRAASAERNMKSLETLPGNAQHLSLTPLLRSAERRSRCFSPTSNASLVSVGCDYEAHVASKMNLPSPQSPKTSGN